MKHSPDAGFTLVEMLVTMVLGVLFVGTLYQLYIVTIQSATEANRDAKASIVGYELLRREVGDGTPMPCTNRAANRNLTTDHSLDTDGLPQPVNATIIVDCPYSTTAPQISRVSVTVRYGQGSSQSEVRHAMLSSH